MIKGIHYIGLSVQNLAQTVDYYRQATSAELIKQYTLQEDAAVGALFGLASVSLDAAVLRIGNAYLELMQFHHPHPEAAIERPLPGPGITHACFQSPFDDPVYDKFKAIAKTQMISRGEAPIDMAGAGYTYAYGRDPEGNIFEMEQLAQPTRSEAVWLGHVALATADIERLASFYNARLLGGDPLPPPRRLEANPRIDEIADIDNLAVLGTWVPTPNMPIEIWQYLTPPTPSVTQQPTIFGWGYNKFCFEVDDIARAHEQLQQRGVSFLSAPVRLNAPESLAVCGRDPDGNLFLLQQFLGADAHLSLDTI